MKRQELKEQRQGVVIGVAIVALLCALGWVDGHFAKSRYVKCTVTRHDYTAVPGAPAVYKLYFTNNSGFHGRAGVDNIQYQSIADGQTVTVEEKTGWLLGWNNILEPYRKAND